MRGATVFLWEQWRQTWKALAFIAATLALYALMLWKFAALVVFIFSKNEALVIATAYVPVLGAAALLFVQENRGRVGFAYPRRMLVLPVHTFTLVAAPFLYRVATVAAFGFAAGWICDAFLKEVYFVAPQVLLLVVVTAAAHAFVFLVCGYGAGTGTALFVAAFAVASPFMKMLLTTISTNVRLPSPIPDRFIMPEIGYGRVEIAAGLLVFWFVVAYTGARYARSEVAEDPVGGLVRVATRLTYFGGGTGEFETPAAAQRWLEWRRGAYLFPWISLALGLVLMLTFRVSAAQLENRFLVVFNLMAIAPAIVAALVGYTVTRSGSDYQWFVGARPLTTATIGRAKLFAGFKALAWAYMLLLVAFVIAFKIMFPNAPVLASIVQDLRVITSNDGPNQEGGVLLLTVSLGTLLGVWALFWLARISGAFVWLAGAIVSVWYYSAGNVYTIDTETGVFITPMTIFIWAMSALMAIAAVVALVVAVYRKYIGVVTLVAIIAGWAVLVAGAAWANKLIPIGSPMMVAAWLLLPAAPLASVPLTLEWQRHR